MTQPTATRRFPLHLHISLLFTLLLLISGSVLALFNYQQTSRIILSSSQQLFQQFRQEVQLDLHNTYQPIRNLLAQLALDPRIARHPAEQRHSLLPSLAQGLRAHPQLAALYIGDDQGNFLMLRALRNDALRQRFAAPAEAQYQLWLIERNSEGLRSRHEFYDAGLQKLAERDNPQERFDPRQRSWYRSARAGDMPITTEPYVFFSSGDLGTTLARLSGMDRVIAADLTLAELNDSLARHRITPSTEVVLFDPNGRVIAYPGTLQQSRPAGSLQPLSELGQLSPSLAALKLGQLRRDQEQSLTLAGRAWQLSYSRISEGGPRGLRLLLLAPEDELLADAHRIRWQSAVLTLLILLLCIPLGWMASRLVVRPLHSLLREAEAIRRFDFNYPASGRSLILEVDQLARSMARMKDSLASFMEISASLSAEKHFDTLLQRVLQETLASSKASGGLIYLLDDDNQQLSPSALQLGKQHFQPHELGLDHYKLHKPLPSWLDQALQAGQAPCQETLSYEQAGDYAPLLSRLQAPRVQLLAVGLHNRQGEALGVLVLLQQEQLDEQELSLWQAARVAFVQALAGVAALCLDSQRLLVHQKQLLDAFIQLMAGAIDAKSPYTGGHCQRVPELTLMLARAAASSEQPAFAQFRPDAEQWEALHIAAWLHDCGKVTTPEYVVDKASKLETLYDRIHEIRMRFEVLKRDAWIDYWQACHAGGASAELTARRDARLAELDDDFAFVAHCNLGSENMADADLQRLQRIAEQRWVRTLDDRLGLSWEETQRKLRTAPATLPCSEPLLADRDDHLIAHNPSEQLGDDNPWGFRLQVPAWRFNRGELYNLSVRRGTLTSEERFLINQHIVQTIIMLERLPFPPHLRQVPEIAGGHHEKMDGTGYPRGLRREQMSLPARMMAIADIFEALTAVDRPYKVGKTLSQALQIMADMCRQAHIDPELFRLFIEAQVYEDYARRFLSSEQIDAIAPDSLLTRAGLISP